MKLGRFLESCKIHDGTATKTVHNYKLNIHIVHGNPSANYKHIFVVVYSLYSVQLGARLILATSVCVCMLILHSDSLCANKCMNVAHC